MGGWANGQACAEGEQGPPSARSEIIIKLLFDVGVDPGEFSKFVAPELDENTVLNNYGDHINMKVEKNRQKNASESELKYILFWNEAYGTKEYDIGFGRQPFYDNLCPETRCFATDDRNLKPAEKFDAVFFHQRSLDFKDIPDKKKRKVFKNKVDYWK